MKRINHPNILKAYEILQNEGYFYLVLEYCKDGDLFIKLKNCDYKMEESHAS